MKKNIKLLLLTVLVFAVSFNTAFARVDKGALDLFLNKLANTSEENRIDGSNLLSVYLVKNDQVDLLKKEIDIYIKPHHEKELKEHGYTIDDVRAELEVFRPMSLSDRKKIVKAVRDGDTQTISNILNPGNGNKPGGGFVPSPGPTQPEPTEPEKPEKPVDKDKDKPSEIEVVFKDIKNHRYEAEIVKLTQNGIINGRTETKFDPNGEITRAEFVALVDRALKLEAKNTKMPFKDMKAKTWYYDSVKRAYDNNIINGKSKDKFEPNSKITREEMATVVMRVLGKDDRLDKLDKTDKDMWVYADSKKVSKWAKDNVNEAVKYGILEDRKKNLESRNNATRAEAAKALERVFEATK